MPPQKNKRMIACRILMFALLLLASREVASGAETTQRYESVRPLMGTTVRIVAYAQSNHEATKAFDAAFDEMHRLVEILSDYESTSEVSRLSQAGPGRVKLGPELWEVLRFSTQVSEATDGAFDVTIGPLSKAWRRMRRRHKIDSALIDQLLPAVGYKKLQLDESSQSAVLAASKMRIDLGGVAKGYIIDAGLRVLYDHDLKRALVDAGGDMAIGHAPPQSVGWKISVAQSKKLGARAMIVELANCGVATSGDAYQFVEIQGKRYSHILNPQTGYGVTSSRTVTVFAPSAMQADAWASAISVLGPRQGFAALANQTGHAAVVTTLVEKELAVEKSPNFAAWLKAH
ncbi:MAG: FAD:protein FMN transferase [Blastopirellula sp. JB062]